MANIFNTDFELSLRVLLLLDIYDSYLSQDVIRDLDLLATYGKEFGISDINLHGDNSYSFSEMASRHNIIKNAIKKLVTDGLVLVKATSTGFGYKISLKGKEYVTSMTSDYVIEYQNEVKKIKLFTQGKSEQEIHNYVYNRILRRKN